MRKSFSAAVVLLVLSCLAWPGGAALSAGIKDSDSYCNFTRRGLEGSKYCDISVLELVANSQGYVGRNVFTVSYALYEGNDRLILAPTKDMLANGDFLSCVRVKTKLPIEGSMMARKGVYVMQVAGKLRRLENSWCKLELSDSVIFNPQFIEKI